ncbi:MAG TPA: hypothetical protein VGF55_30650, partial [Gemmataceae bacterium]
MSRATTAELVAALEPAVGQVARLDRRPSAYSSSFALEELDVELAGGRTLNLVFKDLGRHGLLSGARAAKPVFLHDPRREIAVYRHVLAAHDLGTAVCHAAVCDDRAGRYWLFLERVAGVELYQVGEFATWQAAAAWLARLHARLADDADRLADEAHLLRHDAAYYRLWPRRACEILAAKTGVAPAARDRLAALAAGYEAVVGRLTALPATVIHGEFYASNVLVAGGRVCPVDWEMAAVGPGLIDLAALTAGRWTDAQRSALAAAYHAALSAGGSAPPLNDLRADLDWCRLHLAVQWLGWSADWTPPADHAQDWL